MVIEYHFQMSLLKLCPSMSPLQIDPLISLLGGFRPHAGFAWCGEGGATITTLPTAFLALS